MRSAFLFRFLVLVAVFCCVQTGGAPDPYSSEFERSPPEPTFHDREMYQRIARAEQERYRKRVSIPHAVGEDAVASAPARKSGTRTGETTGTQHSGAPARVVFQNLLLAIVCVLAGILAARKLGPQILDSINTKFNPWMYSPSATEGFASKVRAEEEAFSEFLAAFRVGPAPARRSSTVIPDHAVSGETGNAGRRTECNPLGEFFGRSPELLVALHKRHEEICRAPGTAARQKALADLCRLIGDLKGLAGLQELRPAWQMACAVEGLVKQLTGKASDVTQSTLRTVGSGLDLLHELCVYGLNSDLVTNPPFRLLAVDDDRISRHAVSCAVKKAFNQPDLAENGEAALVLASEHPYDLIFLDVQMPGMDGFELCSKIRATECNRATPVVFVTCQSDFNARAKSTLCGGNDLIAKPFLTFEITVKALTLAVHRRLFANDPIADASKGSVDSDGLPSSLPEPVGVVVSGLRGASAAPPTGDRPVQARNTFQEFRQNTKDSDSPEIHGNSDRHDAPIPGLAGRAESYAGACSESMAPRHLPTLAATVVRDNSPLPSGPLSNAHAEAFFTCAPAQVGALGDFIQGISQNADADVRREMLVDLLLRIHSLTLNADLAGLRPVFQMSAALEGLVKKLLERSGHFTGAALQTVAAAVELLNDLCVKGVKLDMIANPPIRILVVDDDLIARRAIAGALQMSFEKPDTAENGEAALVLAAQQFYDVIFLDVLMPGMDGFTVCSRIHKTTANSHTPVVLVTNYTDSKFLTQSALCGGSDITTKPFINAEITVKALTFALRHRLEKLKTAQEFIPERHESGTIESCPA